ncbi:hypothetical protein LO80_05225 [Candidatus Francisella endociliophora]|uniref:ATP-grasp domain-containing protein n=1 Tax=Candidatus Francisella endociliophora TaxID=653937 RepID=A0A097EPD0_9GAMM|nr:ATP-grasp domain-containing protein [Francisella sp. FSC1006]AIT09422.1 hypothetical protein LO80_05225 [Francisella sp. FSC1006]
MDAIVIVDPFSSCDYIYEKLKQTGLYILTLIYNDKYVNLEKILSYDYDSFVYIDSFDSAYQVVVGFKNSKKANIRYILNGSDDSSHIAEGLLKEFLPEYQNGEQASLRDHKFEMLEYLKTKNLSKQNQLILTKYNYLSQLKKIKYFNFPIIVKPYLYGSSSAGVHLYTRIEDIEEDIFDQRHYISGKKFEAYIAQEFLQGDEYVVDTVSFKGKHIVTAIFKYDKSFFNSGDAYFSGVSIVDPYDPVCDVIKQKIFKVFDVLEISTGVNHTELVVNKDKEVELIEINPRLSGGSGSLLLMSSVYSGYGCDQYTVLFNMLGISIGNKSLAKYNFCKSFYLYSHNFSDEEFKVLFLRLVSTFKYLSFDRQQTKLVSPSKKFHDVRKIVVVADNELEKVNHDVKLLAHLEEG